MKRILIVLAVVSGVALGGFWLWPRPPLAAAHCAERKVSIWNRVAQVREPVATLSYGERIGIVERRKDNVRVRTQSGVEGWIDQKYLMSPELWQRGRDLRSQAFGLKPYARGATKVATNVRAEPGREGPKIYQYSSDVRVEILDRKVVEWMPPAPAAGAQPAEPESPAESGTGAVTAAFPEKRREDWLLVRGMGADGEIAGWVLGRFLTMDYPGPLRDYAAGIRFLAWYELTATSSVEGPRPTYLAFGVDGPEGQRCDFTLLRVYTWNPKRLRYETAYVESALCGRFPVTVQRSVDLTQEASFRFVTAGKKGDETREYRSKQNVVRRVRK